MQHMIFAILNVVYLVLSLFFLGCASSRGESVEAAKQARYWEAIREDEAQKEAERLALREQEALIESQQSAEAALEPSRDIAVTAEDFDTFFAHGPAHALGFLSLKPVRDGVQLIAYEVEAFPRGELHGVDLRVGDLIVAIEGVLPANPDTYFGLWERVREARKGVRIGVLRAEQSFEILWRVFE